MTGGSAVTILLFFFFLNAFEIIIKKRSGTRSGTLHICGSTPTRDSWKIRKTQKKKKNVKNKSFTFNYLFN